jgi:tetratricopeptide (TPR) repeat protein
LEPKDVITIVLSSCAICVSIASFMVSFRQRSFEDKRSIRKALTDVVADLAQVDLAYNQLRLDHPKAIDENIVAFRRTYSTQRRYLANHGEFLMQEIDEFVTDVDCMSLARAFEAIGDYDRAEKFYKLAIERSPTNSLRAMNLRGLARFSFYQGNAAKGRACYQESLQLALPDTDSFRRSTAETYMLWARVEQESGFASEAENIRKNALSSANRIANSGMREEIIGQIQSTFLDNCSGPIT